MPALNSFVSTRSLVLGMADERGAIDAAELYDVADACGFTVHQVRLCIARLVADGLLSQNGRGRKASLQETKRARQLVDPGLDHLRFAWSQDTNREPWDGRWHLVAFALDEEHRPERAVLREELLWTGAALGGGLYVSPNPWEERVSGVARELGVEDRLVLAEADELTVGKTTDGREIVASLWPIEEVADRWRSFVDDMSPLVQRIRTAHKRNTFDRIEFLAATVEMTARFELCMLADPLIPPELLPENWPGPAGRALLLSSNEFFEAARERAGTPSLTRRYDAIMAELIADSGSRTTVRRSRSRTTKAPQA
jgi:phenylacetic acid degradation operon negative regulatory protein